MQEYTKIFNINQQPLVYIKESNIKNAGKGLFAKKHISRNKPVVLYYGEKIPDDIIEQWYEESIDEYNLNKHLLRAMPHNYTILGDTTSKNLNLAGVYVNDLSSIICNKNTINYNILNQYAKTAKKCNIIPTEKFEYPLYMSKKRIKKNEELYVHYGIGFWLSLNGFTPKEIYELNKVYNFQNFYVDNNI